MEWVRALLLSHVFGDWIVLLDKLTDRHVATPNPDHQVVTFEVHEHLIFEEAVVALGLSDEEGLHTFVGIALVYELCQLTVDLVILVRHVFGRGY